MSRVDRDVKSFVKSIVRKNGRIKSKKSMWTVDEILAVSSCYSTRGEMYKKNQRLYMAAYCRGILDQACAHMVPSRKKKKFVHGVLDVVKVISPAFKCDSLMEFREKFQSEYAVGLRYGIDYVELFDNKENVSYMRQLVIDLGQNNLSRYLGAK